MAVSSRDLARLDLAKNLAVVINTHHKTSRTGGVLTPTTFRLTDARHLRDGGNFFHSRILPGYELDESTGARTAPAAGQARLPKGSSIKGGTEPNVLTFTATNAKDPAGQTLDFWQDYALKGSEIIAYRGAERSGSGVAYTWADYEEVFYGRIVGVQRTPGEWQIRAESPEGRNADRTIVRKSYLGLGYGWEFDNTAGTVDVWAQGNSTAVFVPTSGKWAASGFLDFLDLPSNVVGIGAMTFFSYEARIVVRIREADDQVEVVHHNGVSPAIYQFTAWTLTSAYVGRPFALGVRHDGSSVHLYVEGELVDSVATTQNPAADADDLYVAVNVATEPGSFKIYELWISDDDPGDAEMRSRQAGPILYDRPNQTDLSSVYKFLEGGLTIQTKTADLVFDGAELDLIYTNATPVWVDSTEGDDPGVGGRPRGDSKPFILGKVFNFPPAFRSIAGVHEARPVYEAAPWALTYHASRVNGSPLQIGFTETGSFALRTNLGPDLLSAIESENLARVCIRPVIDAAGVRLLNGSEIEISGGHAEDGIWYCVGIEGGRFVFVEDADGNGFSAEDLTASITVTVPAIASAAHVVDEGDGTISTERVYTGQVAVDAERGGTSPTATASLIWLRNARDRDETTAITAVSFSANHSVTWVGDTGIRDEPWSLGIPSRSDISFRDAFAKLLESYFMWTSDTARVGGNQGVRAGHFAAPAGGGTVFDGGYVIEETIQELDTLPPAWRVVVRHRPNYSSVREGQVPAAVQPGERQALSSDFSDIEVFRDTTIRDDFDGAREVFWETTFWEVSAAIKLGQRLADFLKSPRTWWSFRMMIRPEDVLIGQEISVNQERFLASGAADMIVHGKRHGITGRGVDLVTMS